MRVLTLASVFALGVAVAAVGCGDDDEGGSTVKDGGVAGTTGTAGKTAGTTGTAGASAGTTGTAGASAGAPGAGGAIAGASGAKDGGVADAAPAGGDAGPKDAAPPADCSMVPACIKTLLDKCVVPAGTACTKMPLIMDIANTCYANGTKFAFNLGTSVFTASTSAGTCYTLTTTPPASIPTGGDFKDAAGLKVGTTATISTPPGGVMMITMGCDEASAKVSFPLSCVGGGSPTCTTGTCM